MLKNDTLKLNLLGLPAIHTLNDFVIASHFSKYSLYQMSKRSEMFYREYDIPKKSGTRTISQPSAKLKGLQAWVLHNILYHLKVSNSSKGFIPKSSLKDNLKPHIGSTAILGFDLKDFFDSISSRHVYNVFKKIGYNSLIATILTNICTYKGKLPQGAPTSPQLANLVLWQMDLRIEGLVGKRGITYSRYADDLTFSSLNPSTLGKIIGRIGEIIESSGFEINSKKTRISGIKQKRKITGLVLYKESFGVDREYLKKLRAEIFNLPSQRTTDVEIKFRKVIGRLAYLKDVDPKRYLRMQKYIGRLVKEKGRMSLISLNKTLQIEYLSDLKQTS